MKPMKTLNALTLGALLVVLAPPAKAAHLISLELLPAEVQGETESLGRVTLDAPAVGEGARVFLSSSDPSAASPPSRVTVPAGFTSAEFTIQNGAVDSTTQVTITAALGGDVLTAVLTVKKSPPTRLFLGQFLLSASSFEAWTWDEELRRYTGVTGTGTIDVSCDGMITALPVRFESLTIENPSEAPNAVAGSAKLLPAPAAVAMAGFTLHLEELVLTPSQATAKAKLQLPSFASDRAAAACGGARVDLGSFAFTPDCELYLSLPVAAFGPWSVRTLGMELKGTGVDVDFSSSQSPLVTLPPSFRGLVLKNGDTVAAGSAPTSNTGYLQAHYGFTDAIAGVAGLTARFTLLEKFTFRTLQPLGYEIDLEAGELAVRDGAFQGGRFTSLGRPFPEIRLPAKAVRDRNGQQAKTRYEILEAQPDFDLFAQVNPEGELAWGSLRGSPALLAYVFGSFTRGYVYFSSTFRPDYRPVTPNGLFAPPPISPLNDPPGQLEALGMSGLTIPPGTAQIPSVLLEVRTPDVPGTSPLLCLANRETSWINVQSQGVHAEIEALDTKNEYAAELVDPSNPDRVNFLLGPTGRSYYRKPVSSEAEPFEITLDFTTNTTTGHNYLLSFQFIDSAVYHNEGKGSVFMGGALKTPLEFSDLNFTSTAHCPGAKIQIPKKVTLDYWKLDLVQRPNTSAAGPLSVKTGQVFLVAAGIEEKRHFAKEFWLTWGEVLANGELGRFIFDLDCSGQKFDGFDFVPEDLGLSPYDPDDAVDRLHAYLRVAGTAHFDFFGSNYFHLHDHYTKNSSDPFNNRRIVLSDAAEAGAKPSSFHVAGDWAGTFGSAAFRIRYDNEDQDGFLSDGEDKEENHLRFLWIEGLLLASLNLNSKRICMSVHEGYFENATEQHDFAVGPIGSFGSMKRITGCGCIEGGQLKRIHLEGDSQANADTLVLGAKEYMSTEMDLTPATTDLWVHGDMFVNLLSGTGDVEVVGQAHFKVDRNQDSFEGDVKGKIAAGTFLGGFGGESLMAEGQLNWLVGKTGGENYYSVQGRLAVAVVAPGGVAGLGLEGGFYFGLNAPSDKAWILRGTDPHYKFDLKLPPRLTGVYGYSKLSASVSYFVFEGGYEIYAGLGFFDGGGVLGQMRAHVWGKFLGGFVSADAWAALVFLLGEHPQFEGSLGLKACFAWVLCADVGVGVLVDEDGVHFE